MIDKERLEIGTLKAIGLSNKEILGHYMSITSFILGLACLVGFIIGPLIIPSIMGQKYDILYTLPLRNMFVFPWVNAIGSALIMIGLGFFSTFYSCFKVIRETPSSCMRPIIRKEEKIDSIKFCRLDCERAVMDHSPSRRTSAIIFSAVSDICISEQVEVFHRRP